MSNKQFVVPQASSPGSGGGGGGSGTVTSVGLADSTNTFTITGSPVTTTGTLTLSAFANQTANRILAGPTSGGAAAASFRALVAADLPAGTGTVTSVGLTVNSTSPSGIFTVTGSPVTTSGTLNVNLAGTSGGVPYFSDGTTLSSSGALASNAVVLGGGAGASPKTAAGFTTDGTSQLTLGVATSSTGALLLAGATNGTATITAQATAGTPTLTLPNASGTFAISASSPLVLSATTGALTGPTIVTSAAALTSNALVKGAGLQASAVSTVATDDNTTLTYAGTGGILSTTSGGLKAGANGGAAGVITQFGSTSGSYTQTVNSAGTTNTASGGLVLNAGSLTLNAGSITATGGNQNALSQTTTNGANWAQGQISELITLNTGAATTDSVANLLPANSLIMGVEARITTTITTAANWSLGDATTAARFAAANSTLTSGTTSVGLQHWQGSVATDAAGPVQTAAAKLRITLNANPGAGVIRITVYYMTFVAPTS